MGRVRQVVRGTRKSDVLIKCTSGTCRSFDKNKKASSWFRTSIRGSSNRWSAVSHWRLGEWPVRDVCVRKEEEDRWPND